MGEAEMLSKEIKEVGQDFLDGKWPSSQSSP